MAVQILRSRVRSELKSSRMLRLTTCLETIRFFTPMERCHHLVFAGSLNAELVSFLRDRCDDTYLGQRLKLIEGVPLTRDLGFLTSQSAVLRFPLIFRSEALADPGPVSSGYPPWRRRNDPRTVQDPGVSSLLPGRTASWSGTQDSLHFNKAGDRLDTPVPNFNKVVAERLKSRKLCNRHYLTHCQYSEDECNSSHDFRQLTEEERLALRGLARSVACRRGKSCEDRACCASHHCRYGANCTKGEECQFPPVTDKEIAEVR